MWDLIVKTGLQKMPMTVLMMTVFAFELFYFVKNKSCFLIFNFFVTFVACNIDVFSIQRKKGFTVIEFCGRFKRF